MAVIGVYAIINRQTSTWYVGSTCRSFARRWQAHRNALNRKDHGNNSLLRAWQKYGEGVFDFIVLEEMSTACESEIRAHEQVWLDMVRLDGCPIYNAMWTCRANKMTGVNHTLVSREKMSRARVGRKLTEEWKQKIRVSSRGIRKPGTAMAHARPYPAFRNKRTGEIIPAGCNLTALCRQLGMASSSYLSAVVNGRALSYHGWELLEREEWRDPRAVGYPAFRNRVTGKMIPPGYNLSKLCRECGLSNSCMSQVKNGRRQSHKGWEALT